MKAADFIDLLKKNGIRDFTGVPCSVFKEVIAYLEKNENYLIASNEGEAMGFAAGISLANRIPAVFMQNDGFGNAVNPLTSLQKLYEFPTLLVISWRGEPGKKDAPQHLWSGKTLLDLLKVFQVDHVLLEPHLSAQEAEIKQLIDNIGRKNSIGAIICRKGIFEKEKIPQKQDEELLSREEASAAVLEEIADDVSIFSTTGKPSREIYKLRDRNNNFYVVGSMGCTASIAFGFHRSSGGKTVVFDGDGAVLMHAGTLATIGYYQPEKFLHICLDNETYESTGGQTAVSAVVDLSELARASKYREVAQVKTAAEIRDFVTKWNKNPRLSFLHIKVKNVTDPDLGRPKETPLDLKKRFMNAHEGSS
ncbi:MAG: phosphonopyruvate decarboxylase [Candidatus Aminicenantes bacterium]|nr:phosphonopyruvate decarboxylase [Candidatus Aminicenantes bacterium]